jgi:hypothetical protein
MEELVPMSEAEFAATLAVALAACRARKLVRGTYRDEHNASALARTLWLGGLRPLKGPGLQTASADQYPGNHSPK